MQAEDKKTGKVYGVGITATTSEYFCEETQKVEKKVDGDYVLFNENLEIYTHRKPEDLENDFIIIDSWGDE